jgi:EthD domain
MARLTHSLPKVYAVIKLMRCLKRRSDISAEEFRRFWNDPEYEALVGNLGEMSEAISHRRSLTLQIDINKELVDLHGTLEPYDGVVEICWKNAQAISALRNSDKGVQAVDEVLAFEDQFVERTASRYFFTE